MVKAPHLMLNLSSCHNYISPSFHPSSLYQTEATTVHSLVKNLNGKKVSGKKITVTPIVVSPKKADMPSLEASEASSDDSDGEESDNEMDQETEMETVKSVTKQLNQASFFKKSDNMSTEDFEVSKKEAKRLRRQAKKDAKKNKKTSS